MKKYEFTGETITDNGKVLHRIRAVRTFGRVRKGQLGGYVESEDNLSHDGNAWVGDKAIIYGNAHIGGNADIGGYAEVGDNARVVGNARVNDHAKVFRDAQVFGNAVICGNAWVYGSAWVGGNTETHGTWIFGDARIYSNKDLKEMEIRNERRINRRNSLCGTPIRR